MSREERISEIYIKIALLTDEEFATVVRRVQEKTLHCD